MTESSRRQTHETSSAVGRVRALAEKLAQVLALGRMDHARRYARGLGDLLADQCVVESLGREERLLVAIDLLRTQSACAAEIPAVATNERETSTARAIERLRTPRSRPWSDFRVTASVAPAVAPAHPAPNAPNTVRSDADDGSHRECPAAAYPRRRGWPSRERVIAVLTAVLVMALATALVVVSLNAQGIARERSAFASSTEARIGELVAERDAERAHRLRAVDTARALEETLVTRTAERDRAQDRMVRDLGPVRAESAAAIRDRDTARSEHRSSLWSLCIRYMEHMGRQGGDPEACVEFRSRWPDDPATPLITVVLARTGYCSDDAHC